MRQRVKMVWAACRLLAQAPGWLRLTPASAEAREQARAALGRFARGCGLRIDPRGQPLCGGTLFVANHVSWTDIVALGTLCDAAFVARDDLAAWPMLGRLARHHGTIFVERGRRTDSGRQVDAVRSALARGRDVILFAEGTTSDGSGVLPFRSALLAAADAAARVQPVAIVYLDTSGAPLGAERRRRIAWIGDDSLGAMMNAFAEGPVMAAVSFLPSLAPADFANRKALAEALWVEVARAHARSGC